MVNHDWIFAGNQFKKTFNELLFTKGKWIEDRFGWFTYSANCVGERCLDVGRFEFTEEEAEFPFLGAWEFLDVGVLEAFVVGCRRVQPINIVCCQFLIVFFWFCLHAMVDIIENESFLDLRSRRQHRRRIRYSRHCGWRRRRQKLRWRTRRHCRRGGTQRRQIDLQWINTRGHVMFFFLLFCINLLTIVFFWGGGLDIHHGCNECWSCYFYRGEEWVRPIRRCVGVTCAPRNRIQKQIFWSLEVWCFLSFNICSTSEQYSVRRFLRRNTVTKALNLHTSLPCEPFHVGLYQQWQGCQPVWLPQLVIGEKVQCSLKLENLHQWRCIRPKWHRIPVERSKIPPGEHLPQMVSLGT